MNKFLLTFKDSKIEKDYQENKLNTLQKPIFYWLLVMSFTLNLLKVILDYTYYTVNNQSWMNVGFVILVILELFLACYKKQYIKYALIISNLSAGLLQINFDESNTFPQEYYSYGSYYAMLSVVVYFMTDFPYSVFQVFIHLSMKIFFTTIKSHRIDMLGIILGLITNVFLVLTLYICDWNSRRQFLLNLREVRWEESLPFIIKKPFYLFTYKDKNMSFQVNRAYNQDFFPYYNQEDCCGCNFRQFLRKCKVENNNLEIYLFDKRNEKLDFDLVYQNKTHKFDIRVCAIGLDQINYLIILEKLKLLTTSYIPKQTNLRQKIFQIKKTQIKYQHQKHFLLGVFSMFLYNNKEITSINLVDVLQKFSSRYFIISKSKIHIVYSDRSIYQLITYKHQLIIYLIQLFDCLINNQADPHSGIKLLLNQGLYAIRLKIYLTNRLKFQEQYKDNFFIQEIERNILSEEIDERLEISFLKKVRSAETSI
ncbi:unnamed protein product [Paramecium octaurelia]|uniref:Transmembrane protein n=1 Tax=Paramecium octaurelia TaxID=43137 RepID=A0A8S1U028_PAROT|nr:unnamed protein product [Paramecium octaurelia]